MSSGIGSWFESPAGKGAISRSHWRINNPKLPPKGPGPPAALRARIATMFLLPLLLAVSAQSGNPDFQIGPGPLLLRHPTVNQTSIVFKFADDLWKVPRSGGDAIRLTSVPGVVGDPFFSPDGKQIAFSATYDGHDNVYVVPEKGGVPKRLTAHPAPEIVVG